MRHWHLGEWQLFSWIPFAPWLGTFVVGRIKVNAGRKIKNRECPSRMIILTNLVGNSSQTKHHLAFDTRSYFFGPKQKRTLSGWILPPPIGFKSKQKPRTPLFIARLPTPYYESQIRSQSH